MTNAPNDVLYLRFYGEDENPPPLRPITLSSCTGALENVIKSPFPANQGPLRKSVLNIVASPRHGCLEIVLQLDLGIAINSASWKLFGESSDDARALLNDVRDWAEFLLLLVFGGRGLLDLYVHGQQSPKGKLAEGGVATLAISMAPMLIKQAGVLKAIRDLSEIGSKAGFRRIEIQLRDEPRLAIFDRSPDPRSQIGRTYLSQYPGFIDMPVGQLRLQVPASMTKPIGVRLADKEEKSFVADYVDPSSKMRTMILVVWGSKRPLPTSGQKIDVVGKPIPLTEVDITAPVGDLHEKVGAIFYVEKQIIAE